MEVSAGVTSIEFNTWRGTKADNPEFDYTKEICFEISSHERAIFVTNALHTYPTLEYRPVTSVPTDHGLLVPNVKLVNPLTRV